MITIELVGHMDAGDRRLWTEDQDLRPLSELGRRQAARMAAALSNGPVDGLYSSPALRCRQTVDPLAARFGLPIVTIPELRETDGFLPPPGWDGLLPDMAPAMGGTYAAGRASSALRQIMIGLPEGRVIVCSHCDVVPALIAFLIGANGLSLPPLHVRRGGWYTVRADGENVRVEHNDVLPDFPFWPLSLSRAAFCSGQVGLSLPRPNAGRDQGDQTVAIFPWPLLPNETDCAGPATVGTPETRTTPEA